MNQIDQTIESILMRVKPNKRQQLLRKAGQLLVRYEKKRLARQRNLDGTAYQARKSKGQTGRHNIEYRLNGKMRSYVGKITKVTDKYIRVDFGNGDKDGNINLSQKNIFGITPYKRKNRKMLLGFRKFTRQQKLTTNEVRIGMDKANGLAQVHQLGKVDRQGIKMPKRQVFGLNLEAQQIILDFLIKAVWGDGQATAQ